MLDKKRKIKCDCGGKFEEKMYPFGNILSEALVCQKCGYVTLTAEEAKRLQVLQNTSFAEGQVRRSGHSIVLVFPEEVTKMGIKAGEKVAIHPLGKGSLKVDII